MPKEIKIILDKIIGFLTINVAFEIVFVVIVFLAYAFLSGNLSGKSSKFYYPLKSQSGQGTLSTATKTQPLVRTNVALSQPGAVATDTQELKSSSISAIVSCPNTLQSRVSVGGYATICTGSDRLIMKVGPGRPQREILRIYTGTQVKILEGPECHNNWNWYYIEVPEDTKVYVVERGGNIHLSEPEQGWVSEGNIFDRTYYLCPVN